MDERHPRDAAESQTADAATKETLAGWCEATSRVLTPLLSSPQVKARLRVVLQHLDPDYAPLLVRTLARTDPEIPLAALAALPRLVNVVIEATAELSRLLGAYPPALFGSLVSNLVAELRPRPLGEALGRALGMARDLPLGRGDAAAFWRDLAAGFSEGYRGSGLPLNETAPSALGAHAQGLSAFLSTIAQAHPELPAALAASFAEALRAHPALWRQVLLPMLAPLHNGLHDNGSALATDEPRIDNGVAGEDRP